MNLFGLHPATVLSRIQASGQTPRIPSFIRSLLVATAGFTLASLVVYGSWALHGRALHGRLGEGGAYAVWAVTFISLAGATLNPVVIGPASLRRFYALFAAAFTAYALCWSVSWFVVRGRAGEWVGSLAGTAALGMILCAGFGLKEGRWKVVAALFVFHSAGYFLGSFLFDFFRGAEEGRWVNQLLDKPTRSWVAKLSWGFAHGVGLGAGLGYALHTGQKGIRDLIGGGSAEGKLVDGLSAVAR